MTAAVLSLADAEALAEQLREASDIEGEHDDSCESSFISGPNAWSPCRCFERTRPDFCAWLAALGDALDGMERHQRPNYLCPGFCPWCDRREPCPDYAAHERAAVRATEGLRRLARMYSVEPTP